MVVGFCSTWGWCYSGWWVWDLRILAQFQGNKMSPGLFQGFMDGYIKTLRLSPLAVEQSVVVMTAGSQSRLSHIESHIEFLWTISVSDFPPLEIYENSGSPLSSITFTVNSHEDNLSINILFQTLYSIKLVFLLKYTLRFLISKFDLNVKRRPYVF